MFINISSMETACNRTHYDNQCNNSRLILPIHLANFKQNSLTLHLILDVLTTVEIFRENQFIVNNGERIIPIFKGKNRYNFNQSDPIFV